MFSVYAIAYLTVVPLVVGFVALAIGAYRRERMWKRRQVKQLQDDTAKVLAIPRGYVAVQTGPLSRRRGLRFNGMLMLVAAGTPSLKRLLDTLILLERAGLADLVGSILAYECTQSSLVDFANKLPVVFRDRVVYASARDFPNGFGNQPPEWVEGKVGLWGVELEDAVAAVAELHEKRTNEKPGQIMAFISSGGHTYPGVFMVQRVRALAHEAQIVGVVNLPRKVAHRENFERFKARFEDAGVDAWLISDQVSTDWVTQDSVVGALLSTLCAASLGSDGGIDINNIFTNVAGLGKRGGMARFVYKYTDVVAHPYQVDTDGTIKYFVSQAAVMSELRRTIAQFENSEGDPSIDVSVKMRDTVVCDITAVQLDIDPTRDIRDEVERSRDLEDRQLAHLNRPHRHPSVNYETIYSSWSLPIDPEHPRCRIMVVRLQEIDAPLEVVVGAPQDRPKHDSPSELTVAHSRSNGVVLPDDFDF